MDYNNLIPHFIYKKYEELTKVKTNNYEGKIKAGTMFIDIKDFTKIVNYNCYSRKEGYENVFKTFQNIFNNIIKIIYDYDGDVINYEGDALQILFPTNNKISIMILCAFKIQEYLRNNYLTNKKSKIKDKINLKIGLSFGNIKWMIFSNKKKRYYIFKGKALESSAEAQEYCDKKKIIADIVISEKILNQVDDKILKKLNVFESGNYIQIERNENYYRNNPDKKHKCFKMHKNIRL